MQSNFYVPSFHNYHSFLFFILSGRKSIQETDGGRGKQRDEQIIALHKAEEERWMIGSGTLNN